MRGSEKTLVFETTYPGGGYSLDYLWIILIGQKKSEPFGSLS